MREADNPQFITPALKLGRNDRDAMPRLGQRQQGVRVAALEHYPRFQSRHAACCVESTAKSEPAVQQQQRKLGEVGYLDGTMRTK